MNKFFLDKIKRLRSSILHSVRDPLRKLREVMRDRTCTFWIERVTTQEWFKTIKGLKNLSATGVDFIYTKTVKLAAGQISPALAHIIN